MKIYLAGKISRDDWRFAIVGDAVVAPSDYSFYLEERFPVVPNAIGGRHDYTGPFFVDGQHGSTHGSDSHGVKARPDWIHRYPGEIVWGTVAAMCLDAIDRSDLVFAWLVDKTAYGTIAEIGYARGRGKRVVIAAPYAAGDDDSDDEHGDLWFARELGETIFADTPLLALEQVIGPGDRIDEAMRRCQSPIERRLLSALLDEGSWELHGGGWRDVYGRASLLVQHRAPAGGHQYVLDFAVIGEAWRIAVECDGHEFHERTKEQARHDRSRDRTLAAAGWTVLRFTGSEIHRDAVACAREVMAHMRRLGPPKRF